MVQVRAALLEQEAAALLQHFALGQFSESCRSFRKNKFQHVDCTHVQKKKKMKKKEMERTRKIRKSQTPYTVQAPHALVGIKNL